MKRVLAMLAIVVLSLSMCACTASDRRHMNDAKSDIAVGHFESIEEMLNYWNRRHQPEDGDRYVETMEGIA